MADALNCLDAARRSSFKDLTHMSSTSPETTDEPVITTERTLIAASSDAPQLNYWFDHIFVINCAHRPDRLREFWEEINSKKLADPAAITVFPAIIGDYTSHPAGWGGGNGAWGCLKSHISIMETLLHKRTDTGELSWKSALILEDDVFFLPGALENLQKLMLEVPRNWGQVYLGGQNRKPITTMESPNVIQCHSVNRTHAYAVSSGHLKKIYCHVSYMADYHSNKHIDHQLELAHQRGDWDVYGPPRWICGQRASTSNVSGQRTPDLTWQ